MGHTTTGHTKKNRIELLLQGLSLLRLSRERLLSLLLVWRSLRSHHRRRHTPLGHCHNTLAVCSLENSRSHLAAAGREAGGARCPWRTETLEIGNGYPGHI